MKSKKLFFITEIASTHEGNSNVVDYLTKKHINSSSDFIKYQIFKTKNLYNKSDANYQSYKKLEIHFNKWNNLINNFKKRTNIILEPFDFESYNFCKNYKKNVDIKISTSETDNFNIINDALKNFNKVYLNLSGYNDNQIKKILVKYKKNKNKIVLMYGFQSYPSKVQNLRFYLFDLFKKFGFNFGYSDHSIFGFSEELVASSFFANLKNCLYFEKHVCQNLAHKPDDYISSVEFEDFERLMQTIRIFNNLNNNPRLKISKPEIEYAQNMHKKAYIHKNIKKNKQISQDKISFFRKGGPGGLGRLDLHKKNFKTKKNLKQNTFLERKDIKN